MSTIVYHSVLGEYGHKHATKNKKTAQVRRQRTPRYNIKGEMEGSGAL
jgi:hypothetical protein